MIMISDVTLNNVTAREVPTWMKADHYDVLMGHTQNSDTILNRLQQLFHIGK